MFKSLPSLIGAATNVVMSDLEEKTNKIDSESELATLIDALHQNASDPNTPDLSDTINKLSNNKSNVVTALQNGQTIFHNLYCENKEEKLIQIQSVLSQQEARALALTINQAGETSFHTAVTTGQFIKATLLAEWLGQDILLMQHSGGKTELHHAANKVSSIRFRESVLKALPPNHPELNWIYQEAYKIISDSEIAGETFVQEVKSWGSHAYYILKLTPPNQSIFQIPALYYSSEVLQLILHALGPEEELRQALQWHKIGWQNPNNTPIFGNALHFSAYYASKPKCLDMVVTLIGTETTISLLTTKKTPEGEDVVSPFYYPFRHFNFENLACLFSIATPDDLPANLTLLKNQLSEILIGLTAADRSNINKRSYAYVLIENLDINSIQTILTEFRTISSLGRKENKVMDLRFILDAPQKIISSELFHSYLPSEGPDITKELEPAYRDKFHTAIQSCLQSTLTFCIKNPHANLTQAQVDLAIKYKEILYGLLMTQHGGEQNILELAIEKETSLGRIFNHPRGFLGRILHNQGDSFFKDIQTDTVKKIKRQINILKKQQAHVEEAARPLKSSNLEKDTTH